MNEIQRFDGHFFIVQQQTCKNPLNYRNAMITYITDKRFVASSPSLDGYLVVYKTVFNTSLYIRFSRRV